MKKFMLATSLLCFLQLFPVYGRDVEGEADKPEAMDIPLIRDIPRVIEPQELGKERSKERNNDTLIRISNDALKKKPSSEKISTNLTSSPKAKRTVLLNVPNLNLRKVDVGPPSVQPDSPRYRPNSPGAKSKNSLSCPATPAVTPNGTPRGESMSVESLTRSTSCESLSRSNNAESMSLNSSSENLPLQSEDEEKALKVTTDSTDPLRHLVIIPDGNRRWAKEQNPSVSIYDAYYKCAVDILPHLAKVVFDMGVETLTYWLWSVDNWKRSQEEIDIVMENIAILIDNMLPIAHALKLRIVHMGNKTRVPLDNVEPIPDFLWNKITSAMEETRNYPDRVLNLAVSCSGQDDMVRAVQGIALNEPGYDFANIKAADISRYMDTADQKYPQADLVIRTTVGDHKASGFMAWMSQYKQHFTECYAPDLTKEHIEKAFAEYGDRARLFGR